MESMNPQIVTDHHGGYEVKLRIILEYNGSNFKSLLRPVLHTDRHEFNKLTNFCNDLLPYSLISPVQFETHPQVYLEPLT